MQKINRAIIFVHYDKNNIVDDYVYYYLKELQKNASYLVFISTAKLSKNIIERVSLHCSKVIVRENVGYDFMSYKVGLESFDYQDYNEVVICNDSVYGPLYPIKNLFDDMQNDKCDFWGITDSTDTSYHLQSYFIVFKNNVISSDAFKNFWQNVRVLNNKNDIIKNYEVGLTKFLLDNGFASEKYVSFQLTNIHEIYIFIKKLTPAKILNKISSIISGEDPVKKIGKINITHQFWKEILLTSKMPFIKIELLRDNPINMEIHDFEQVIQQVSDYDTKLIKNHLARIKTT